MGVRRGRTEIQLGYTYDAEKHQVMLAVNKPQKVEGRVGLFRVPVEVEITTASGPKLYKPHRFGKTARLSPCRGVLLR